MEFTDFPVRPDVRTHLIVNCIISGIVFITVVARFATRKYLIILLHLHWSVDRHLRS
jgi:hypothetical protein